MRSEPSRMGVGRLPRRVTSLGGNRAPGEERPIGWLAAGVWHEKPSKIHDNAKTPRGPRLPASGQRVDYGIHPSFGLSMPRLSLFAAGTRPGCLV